MLEITVSVSCEFIAEWQDENGVGLVYATFVDGRLLGIAAAYKAWDELD